MAARVRACVSESAAGVASLRTLHLTVVCVSREREVTAPLGLGMGMRVWP